METAVKVNPVSVEIKGLKKQFGEQVVLDGIDLSLKPGEIFVLMGPSGSGKSVLLRHLAALMDPDAGEVKIEGLDATKAETHEKFKTAMVFQAGALLNSMTVYDNLALYHREHRSYTETEIRAKVHQVMDALSISASDEKLPAELSGGMKKRVAVARAIIMEPQLILYDEPTSELDPILAATTAELIATVRKESGATSLVVTHDRDLALSIADRVGLLLHGQLAFIGTPKALSQCDDPEVKEFMHPQINLDEPRFRNKE